MDRFAKRTLWLLGLLWLLAAGPAMATPASGDDYCGAARPQEQLRCPRTKADTCACYLSTRTNPGEHPPACPRQSVAPRVRRPSPPLLRQLPRLEPKTEMAGFLPAVPTPPPRASLL